MKKYIAELIGTFALVFCGTGAIVIDQQTKGAVTHVGIAITFGLIVMAMIYALGNISGAHIPARTNVARPSGARQCGISIFIEQCENQTKAIEIPDKFFVASFL